MGRPRLHENATERKRAERDRNRTVDHGTPELQAKRALDIGGEPFTSVETRVNKGTGEVRIVAGSVNSQSRAWVGHSATPLGQLYARGMIDMPMYRAGENFCRLSHALFGNRASKAAKIGEWIPGEGGSPLTEEREIGMRRAYERADDALLHRAGRLAWLEVHRVAIDRSVPSYRDSGDTTAPMFMDLKDGLEAIARHWRMYSGDDSG